MHTFTVSSNECVPICSHNGVPNAHTPSSRDEWLATRDKIINNAQSARNYFYVERLPLAELYYKAIPSQYQNYVDVNDICTIMYTELYDGAKWTRLKAYRGDCSFDSWVSFVSKQVVIKRLTNEGLLNPSSVLTPSNTNLTLDSMTFTNEKIEVINLLPRKTHRMLLKSIYVRKRTEIIKSVYDLSDEDFEKMRKKAETALKAALIRKKEYYWRRVDPTKPNDKGVVVNLVTLALSPMNCHIKTSSSEDTMRRADVHLVNGPSEIVTDLLRPMYPDVPESELWFTFLVDKAKDMPWSDESRQVFEARFIHKEPAKVVAQRMGRRSSWVDNRKSDLCKELEIYVGKILREM